MTRLIISPIDLRYLLDLMGKAVQPTTGAILTPAAKLDLEQRLRDTYSQMHRNGVLGIAGDDASP